MLGGSLQIVGMLALLVAASEVAGALWRAIERRRRRSRLRDRLNGEDAAGDARCAWPLTRRHEPEVERLRRKGAL